ncbi:MAG: hypothetical protein JSS53_06360 [Proteobacteria bacterium]|nr:hypothetical protein [Pseudomonadota bacterium]
MNFIEHIVEPSRLLLTWQSSDEKHRVRYVVAELKRVNGEISLRYLTNHPDFQSAKKHGFKLYPAFIEETKVYDLGILDTFMRRLPPKSRGDYIQYLEGLRLKPDVQLSDFGLLGYSSAKLPSDGFSFIHPFDNVDGSFEFLLEVAGYSYYVAPDEDVTLGAEATFKIEKELDRQEDVIKIYVSNKQVGYVTRALIPAVKDWLIQGRINNARVEKKNGSPNQPTLYLYLSIAEKK